MTEKRSFRQLGRALSEMSPLNPIIYRNENRRVSEQDERHYGSIIPSFIRNSLRSYSTTSQTLSRSGDSMGSLGHRALLNYIEINDLPGLKTFLDTRHLPVDDRDENGTTVLMVAATRGLTQFVREFIARGADLQAEDLDNWTALLYASKYGHFEIVTMLVEHGANIEQRDMGGWTSLMWAAYRGHTEVVQFLLEKGADIFAHGNYHLGALLWAAGRGHKEIVQMLVCRGAKVNVGDKYGTTALVWACRKGNAEIVEVLLKAGANVDTAGMYSWTALLVAVSGGHHECVTLLLEKKPNVNALDKDGMTALTIACREGLQEIASALIAAGAYVNIQDRAGDTPLIHAVKNGHRGVVEILLKRHADVDIQGKDRKTALYTAVEKGHTAIVKFLLNSNPDLELSTKDGDTALLRAVRNRNLECVQMLLERRAKVAVVDRRGDTALHIAMRARSKAIVEALLRNPKNSQLLYCANKAGETPYGLDTSHQKTILGQVFGARRLNTNEDSEGMLGYGLYSSALADVLSEPTLKTPITVGLYAKWGSGKSFLLAKLKEEMISFACQWAEPPIKAPWLTIIMSIHLAIICGTAVGISTLSYIFGFISGFSVLLVIFVTLRGLTIASKRYNINWTYSFYRGIMKRLGHLRLILQVAFCHPGLQQNNSQPMPVRFQFAEVNSATPTGDIAVGQMIALLFEAIEFYYGSLPTRLYRAFRPKIIKSSTDWKWRRMCCVPVVILFELFFLALLMLSCLLIIYYNDNSYSEETKNGIAITLYFLGGILLAGCLANLNVWARAFISLFLSQGRHVRRAMKSNEGAPLTALGVEVSLMTDMVMCLDAFTRQQSRLVGIIDALDTCDTERILNVLNAVQTLLSSPNRPFVLLIAVDPHVIAKAAEANSRRLFTEGGIGGHDFLRNLVHLPVYLQNSGLRKVQRAQQTAMVFRRALEGHNPLEEGNILTRSASARRLSNTSEIMASTEKLRSISNAGQQPQLQGPPSSRGGSKKMRLSESIASSIGSNLHRLGVTGSGGAGSSSGGMGGGGGNATQVDLTKVMLTDDYFSDVNPRSMRRLMNVIYITVRLLKAFQIDFSWYRLSSWLNLTEQWPVRASMIVLQHDQSGDSIDDNVPLQALYDKVRVRLPCLREAAPLLDLDRDERKLEAFLQLHKHDLLVSDLRIFLPFSINLDPYLRKVLKEDQQAMEDEGIVIPTRAYPTIQVAQLQQNQQQQNPYALSRLNYQQSLYLQPSPPLPNPNPSTSYQSQPQQQQSLQPPPPPPPPHYQTAMHSLNNDFVNQRKKSIIDNDIISTFSEEIYQIHLSTLSTDNLINLLKKVTDLHSTFDKLAVALQENSINGRVLMHCDLTELKSILELNFGHWELFRLLITTLRDIEKQHLQHKYEQEQIFMESQQQQQQQQPQPQQYQLPSSSSTQYLQRQLGYSIPQNQHHQLVDDSHSMLHPSASSGSLRQKNVMEKQVTLEEQMICGALQTLNEEAFEDVLGSERPSPTVINGASDLTDFPFVTTTINSGQQMSRGNSPILIRRDSILKHSGSIKADKRVSIKNDAPIHMEFINEKRSGQPQSISPVAVNAPQILTTSPPLTPLTAVVPETIIPNSKLIRPSTLILPKNERSTTFKLQRSPSVDHPDEKLDNTIPNNNNNNNNNNTNTNTNNDNNNNNGENNNNSTNTTNNNTINNHHHLHDDESIPLVQKRDDN